MSIVREKIKRVVIEEGVASAVCDGCGERAEPREIFDGFVEHPVSWHVLMPSGRPVEPGTMRIDLKAFCSWECLEQYAARQSV